MLISHLNCRSLISHFTDIRQDVLEKKYDVFAVSETWLSTYVDDSNDFEIDSYALLRKDRVGRGGGVGLYIRSCYKHNVITTSDDIEQLWIRLETGDCCVGVGVVYRPPNMDYGFFLSRLEETFTNIFPQVDALCCLGDFNIDMLQINSPATKRLSAIIDSFGMVQAVEEPTRVSNTSCSLIDLILISGEKVIKERGVVDMHHVSDHSLVYVRLERLAAEEYDSDQSFEYRDYSRIDMDQLNYDLETLPLFHVTEINDINDKLSFFNDCLMFLMNKHCPTKIVKRQQNYRPWLTDNLKLIMKLRDKALKKHKRKKTPESWEYYKQLRNYANIATKNEKKGYLRFKLNNGKPNDMWKVLKNLDVNTTAHTRIPTNLMDANMLSDYFGNIASVNIPQQNKRNILSFYNYNTFNNISNSFKFSVVTDDLIYKFLHEIKTHAVGSDGISIQFLKICCPYIVPILTHIINFCIENSVFPDCWKESVVLPVPKRKVVVELGDLRPISILPVMSKILEKVLKLQMQQYLDAKHLLPELQSGFRKNHSCSTALLKITNDIFQATDRGDITLLLLLDYSRAFDTLHHDILCSILHYLGFHSNSQLLLLNYLTGRKQKVRINDSESLLREIVYGVPQGSILGPLLFSLYISQLMTRLCFCNYHLYADDTQLYKSFNRKDLSRSLDEMNKDLTNLLSFSNDHGLLLNASKSKLLVFGRRGVRASVIDEICVKLGDAVILPSNEAKNLGLLIDSDLRFKSHINACLRKSYSSLKLLFNSRHFLTRKLKVVLTDSLVLSHFNFCDLVFSACLDCADRRRIQVVQNRCIRFIFGLSRREHVSHKLSEIGWLNMEARRRLHAACFYHRLISGGSPSYLVRLIKYRTDVHNINIRRRGQLSIPVHKTEFYKRSFSYSIARAMNDLDFDYRSMSGARFRREMGHRLLELNE